MPTLNQVCVCASTFLPVAACADLYDFTPTDFPTIPHPTSTAQLIVFRFTNSPRGIILFCS
jgi:hypothetical protein